MLYLSHYFKRYRQAYYDSLQRIRDVGDWEAWLLFFLEGVAEVSNEAAQTARKILQLREEHREAITLRMGRAAGNGHKLLEELYERPIVTVKTVQNVTGTSYPAANELVKRLTQLGILEEITGYARNRRFRYEPYIRLFHEDEQDRA